MQESALREHIQELNRQRLEKAMFYLGIATGVGFIAGFKLSKWWFSAATDAVTTAAATYSPSALTIADKKDIVKMVVSEIASIVEEAPKPL